MAAPASNEIRTRAVPQRTAKSLFEPTLEALFRPGKQRCFRNRPVLAHPHDAVGKRMHWPGRADTLADDLNDLSRPDHRDVLHAAQAAITRTATGQAREQRSEEK